MHPTNSYCNQFLDSQPLFGLNISERVYLDDVQCDGTEESLLDCNANSVGEHNCGQFDGAGVRCEGIILIELGVPV